MTNKEKFGKAQSPLAKRAFAVRMTFHLVSIPFTTFGLYQSYVGGDLVLALVCVALAVALAIQYLIGSQESTVARQLVWWAFPNAGAVCVFILSSAMLGGLIWYNHQTSQVGRIDGIEKIVGQAEQESTFHIDSSRVEAQQAQKSLFRQDSLTLATTLSGEIASHKAVLNAELVSVAAMRKKAKSVKSSHPSWSAGIYQNAAKKEAAARSRYNLSVSASRSANAAKTGEYYTKRTAATSQIDSLLTADLITVRQTNARLREQHEATKAIAQSSGNWVVIITSFGSFLVCLLWEAYRRICGLEMEGELYNPSEANKSPLRHFKGFFADHVDVIDSRMEKTRQVYKSASESKGAYQLPRSVVFVRVSLVVVIASTLLVNYVPSQPSASHAGMSQTGWWFILSAAMALIATFWKDEWNGKKATPTTDHHTTPASTPTVAPHITVSHKSGIPTGATPTLTVAPSKKATLGPNKKATPATVRKRKKATADTTKEIIKADKRIRTRCRRAWEYKQEGRIEQSLSAYDDYLEDKVFLESHGRVVTELPEGRLNITGA